MKQIRFKHNGNIVPVYSGDDNVTTFKGEYVYLERPKFAEFHFNGSMPTDTSANRIPASLDFDFKVSGQTLLRAKCELSIQGHGSASYTKKGYSLDVMNESGEDLKVKFGDMIPTSGFHLKAYATDRIHARGVANCNIWRSMIAALDYPYSTFNNKPFDMSKGQEANEIYIADAKYAEDGFPCAVYLNGEFFGLYTLKLKKTRENYALDNKNKSHIFLDSITYTAFFSQPFDRTDWEVKSPKISGYDEGGEITDAEVLANIERLFGFLNSIDTNYANHADYIVLNHWIVWVILCELVSHRDTNGNNYEIMTWDGTHWSISPYDMDLTLGLNAWSGYTLDTSRSGWDIASANGTQDASFWNSFKTRFKNEIKAIYTDFRKRKIIDMATLSRFYIDQVKAIPRKVYSEDAEKWQSIWTNGEPTLEQLFKVLESRIDFLDSQWLVE